MSRKGTSLIGRIYTWLYGEENFRENNYVLLDEDHRPSSECWYEEQPSNHTAHITEPKPTLSHLAALGNFLSDRINWLTEMIGKINLTQSEIANEINLKLDLAEHSLNSLVTQIPGNHAEAFQHLYEQACSTGRLQERMFQEMEQINQGIFQISKRLKSLEKATSAEYVENES